MFLLAFSVWAEPSVQRQQQLEDMLKQECGACHGLTLKGGLGPSLLPSAVKHKSNSALVNTILDGRPGTAMPPWRKFISASEAEWLVSRLRSEGLGDTRQ